MDIQLIKLEERLEKSNEAVRELYDILFFQDDEFEKVFGIQLKDKKGLDIHDEFIIECFCVAFEIDNQSDLKETLKRGGYSEIEVSSILKNFEKNFIPAFKELIKPKNIKIPEKRIEKETEIIEKTESNHISHIDVLSEIENPTPSISAPLTPQREATTESQTTPNSLKPSSKDSSTQSSSPNPSFHSSPSIAPYVNPALHIASKLDQNLSNPSASVPKEMYVSKKPDPYHEPLDL
jgi:hypothetical protein